MKQRLAITAKQWDLNMITAGDYTVSKTIHEHEYLAFKSQHSENESESIAYRYMKKLKELYETEVALQPAVNRDDASTKIANISFAFDNYEIINLLEKRGAAIVNRKEKQQLEIEEKLEEIRRQKADEVSRPVKAFITFETQEGYERAKKIKKDNLNVLKSAVEPTNIIWENMHYTKSAKIVRTIVVVLIIVLLMILTFVLFIVIKRSLVRNNNSFLSLNCDNFDEQITDPDKRLRYAMIDYYGFHESATETKMTGALQ